MLWIGARNLFNAAAETVSEGSWPCKEECGLP